MAGDHKLNQQAVGLMALASSEKIFKVFPLYVYGSFMLPIAAFPLATVCALH